MTRISVIEHLHSSAIDQSGKSLALSNALYFDDSLSDDHWSRDVQLDTEVAADFLRQYNVPECALGRMALYFYDGKIESIKNKPDHDPGAYGFIVSGGGIHVDDDGALRYPFIGFDVGAIKTVDELNQTFVHELRHAADSKNSSLYTSRRAINSLRLSLGSSSLAGGVLLFSAAYEKAITLDLPGITMIALASASLSTAAITAASNRSSRELLERLSIHEFRARRAAKKYSHVKPFYLPDINGN